MTAFDVLSAALAKPKRHPSSLFGEPRRMLFIRRFSSPRAGEQVGSRSSNQNASRLLF
jgi:hypothetical protein